AARPSSKTAGEGTTLLMTACADGEPLSHRGSCSRREGRHGEAFPGRPAASFVTVIFSPEKERRNGTQPGRQEGDGRRSGRSSRQSPVGRGRGVPRTDRRADDGASFQGPGAGRVHACGQEHAGAQG